MTLDSYIQSLRGKSIAVIGLGVSNRPLLRLLLDAGYTVSVRDKRTREAFGEDEAAALEAAGCRLVLGDGGVLCRLPVPHHRRDRLGRKDDDYHHYFRAPEGAGTPRISRRQHRHAAA